MYNLQFKYCHALSDCFNTTIWLDEVFIVIYGGEFKFSRAFHLIKNSGFNFRKFPFLRLPDSRTTSRATPRFPKISYRKFLFHSIFRPEISEIFCLMLCISDSFSFLGFSVNVKETRTAYSSRSEQIFLLCNTFSTNQHVSFRYSKLIQCHCYWVGSGN